MTVERKSKHLLRSMIKKELEHVTVYTFKRFKIVDCFILISTLH